MKKALIIFISIFILAPVSASAELVTDDSKNLQYLFTLAGKYGTYKGDELTISEVPLVVYFADRPVRKAGHLSLEKFIGLWDSGVDSFRKDPPSAELAIYDQSGDKHAVLILQKPQLNGDDIFFKVKRIQGDIPESFGHATLFIDSLGVKKSPSF